MRRTLKDCSVPSTLLLKMNFIIATFIEMNNHTCLNAESERYGKYGYRAVQ